MTFLSTFALGEGANMPATMEATKYFIENGVLFAPGKAASAGGVAVNALEMAQSSQRIFWNFTEVETRLRKIMATIFMLCRKAAEETAFYHCFYSNKLSIFQLLALIAVVFLYFFCENDN